MELPQSYVIDKMHSYSFNVKESQSYLNGCCPVCREGNSWGKKKRLFYFLKDDYFFCHNCNLSWTPFFWIKEVAGLSFKEIKEELKSYDYDIKYNIVMDVNDEKVFDLPALPGECVNLQDTLQIRYFDAYPIVKLAKSYCENRRLFTSYNHPKTFFCCLNDKYHGNRLIIPYYNSSGKIESYISRKLLDADNKAKYLIKFGKHKPIFNLNKIDAEYPYIFIFEGQIDCMFLKNGIAISGTYLTPEQDSELIKQFPFHKRIWVLDNYRFEKVEVLKIIKEKLKNNESVFLYNDEFSSFKDLNEYCIKKEQDYIDPALILESCYSGDRGLLKIGD